MDRYASEQPLMLMKIALNLTDSSLASRSDTHHYQGISPFSLSGSSTGDWDSPELKVGPPTAGT